MAKRHFIGVAVALTLMPAAAHAVDLCTAANFATAFPAIKPYETFESVRAIVGCPPDFIDPAGMSMSWFIWSENASFIVSAESPGSGAKMVVYRLGPVPPMIKTATRDEKKREQWVPE